MPPRAQGLRRPLSIAFGLDFVSAARGETGSAKRL